jgi:hypothetical protein
MRERRKIIQQLQERINKINKEIEKLIQHRYLHTCMTRELLKKSSQEESNDSEEEVSVSDLSIKIIPPEKKLNHSSQSQRRRVQRPKLKRERKKEQKQELGI